MCHALEIDDSHYPAIVHPTAPTLWSALATTEELGGVRGEDFVCAVVLGIDAMARIALSAPATLDNGYHTAIYSGFGSAVTAGKLKQVSREALRDSLGIVFARAAASVQAGSDGALVKRMQCSLLSTPVRQLKQWSWHAGIRYRVIGRAKTATRLTEHEKAINRSRSRRRAAGRASALSARSSPQRLPGKATAKTRRISAVTGRTY